MIDINILKNTFIERLSYLIAEKGLSLTSLSKQTGIPRTTISNWLRGFRVVKIDSLVILANYFEVSTDFLLGRENY